MFLLTNTRIINSILLAVACHMHRTKDFYCYYCTILSIIFDMIIITYTIFYIHFLLLLK